MTDYTKLKVAELKDLLKDRDISLTGLSKKQQLIDRLEEDDKSDNKVSHKAKDHKNNDDVNSNDAKTKVPKKRAASLSPADINENSKENQHKKAKITDAQRATSSNLDIPLDEGVPFQNYHVYIDPDDGVIYDASLNQTNASNNNNKFYRCQVLEGPKGDYKTWTRWGRVGEFGQKAILGNGSLADALRNFDKKFKDKSGLKWNDRGEDPKPGKYVFVERNYAPDSDDDDENDDDKSKDDGPKIKDDPEDGTSPPECTLEPPVRSLMELIFNQQYFAATMSSLNYDANKLPLGKLSSTTITRGFLALKNLGALLDDNALAAKYEMPLHAATEHLSNLYYSLIPHSFGRNRPPIISTEDLLKREIGLLESLSDLKDAHNIIKAEKRERNPLHPLDSHFKGLGMQEMTPLASDSTEFAAISEYLLKTCGQTHHYTYSLTDIFRIERQGELDRFQNSEFAKMASDRRLLWHGSRATNFGGILSQGLRIAPPEAPASGYMFDKGIYLADMSSKSAGYCCAGISDGHALLLLCEAELGKPMQEMQRAMSNAASEAKKRGVYSTWGQGRFGPKGWKDAKCVHESLAGVMMPDTTEPPGETDIQNASLWYNEYICYNVSQVRLRYLLRVRM